MPYFRLNCLYPPLVENEELSLPVKSSVEIKGDQIVLGKKLDNPYTYDNMQSVYNDWCREVGCSPVPFEFSHYYVRFLPKDSIEMRLLESYDIAFFDYPMDYEILKEGNFYVDPTTKDSYCTWLYTSVPADFEFPNMEYELIEKCFIPEELEYENLHLSANSSEYLRIEELLYRAYDRVGAAHLFEIPQESTQNSNDLRKGWFDNFIKWISGYKPKGTITVYDTSLDDYFYVKDIKVKAHTYVHWSTSYTDNNGYYKLPSRFFANCKYSCIFRNKSGFKIYDGAWIFWPANYNMGWHSKRGLSRKIKANTPAWDWATINNAVVYYKKYCIQDTLLKPYSGLNIVALRNYGGSSAPMLNHVGINFASSQFLLELFCNRLFAIIYCTFKPFSPDITIRSDKYNSEKVFQTVCHELSHSIHMRKVGSNFWTIYIEYIVQNYLNHRDTYGSINIPNSGYCGVGEMWGYAMGAHLSDSRYGLKDRRRTSIYSACFKPVIIYLLISEGTLTPKEVYYCLIPSVNTHEKLKDKLMLTYPSKASTIKKTFEDYGF